MKLLLDHIGKYKAASILSPVFKLLEACFELTVPLIVAGVIDNGIKKSDMNYVWSHVPILVLFAIVGFASAITAQYFAAYSACGISSGIRKSLHDKLQTLSISDYEKIGSSGIVTLLTSDVNQIQTGINLFLRLLLRSPFIVIGACIMAATVKPSMALIFVSCTALLAVVIALNMKFSVLRHKEAREGLDSLVKKTSNGITGERVIRGFNKTQSDYEKFETKSNGLKNSQIKAADFASWLNPITYAVVNLAVCLLIYRGSVHFNAGDLTDGQVVALYNYMSQILIELVKLANLIVSVSKAYACLKRAEGLINVKSTANHGTKQLEANKALSVSLKNVCFTYQGNVEESVKDFSVDIRPGETIGIIGSTGCGKSTAASLIAGIYDASEGDVLIDGINIRDISPANLASCVGMSLQKTRLFKEKRSHEHLHGVFPVFPHYSCILDHHGAVYHPVPLHRAPGREGTVPGDIPADRLRLHHQGERDVPLQPPAAADGPDHHAIRLCVQHHHRHRVHQRVPVSEIRPGGALLYRRPDPPGGGGDHLHLHARAPGPGLGG